MDGVSLLGLLVCCFFLDIVSCVAGSSFFISAPFVITYYATIGILPVLLTNNPSGSSSIITRTPAGMLSGFTDVFLITIPSSLLVRPLS